MKDKEKLKAEIENYCLKHGYIREQEMGYTIQEQVTDIATHFYNLGKKQEEPVSEDLEEAFIQSFEKVKEETLCVYDYHAGFVDGAQWQKEQLIAWLTREADYLIEELKKGNKAYGLAEQYRAQLYKEIINKMKDE